MDALARTYQVICNVAEKTFEQERIFNEPVLRVPFPLGEPAQYGKRKSTIQIVIYSPAWNISQPSENLDKTRPGLQLTP